LLPRRALSIPPFGDLADPRRMATIAAAAEANGWDGIFVWDHLLRPVEQATHIADPWVTMTAMAMVTRTITIGPMVTPIARRRVMKLAREAATLDLASGGRLILGIGLGVDSGGELIRTAEITDPRERANVLDEALPVLARLLAGEHVVHRGPRVTIDGITLAPTGLQQPRIPIWLAARGGHLAPVRRAARYEGVCLLDVTPDRYRRITEVIEHERGGTSGYAIAMQSPNPFDPADFPGLAWAIREFPPDVTAAAVEAVVGAPPE
ncbi:MAG TPA: LLM class flavin-dependent oxidoreductase, partial [Ilumatobacteraceae bacterium]|nr:LLM class flavin-dependent oxidoreductase [Ilumatobacteraceae bacterium]